MDGEEEWKTGNEAARRGRNTTKEGWGDGEKEEGIKYRGRTGKNKVWRRNWAYEERERKEGRARGGTI